MFTWGRGPSPSRPGSAAPTASPSMQRRRVRRGRSRWHARTARRSESPGRRTPRRTGSRRNGSTSTYLHRCRRHPRIGGPGARDREEPPAGSADPGTRRPRARAYPGHLRRGCDRAGRRTSDLRSRGSSARPPPARAGSCVTVTVASFRPRRAGLLLDQPGPPPPRARDPGLAGASRSPPCPLLVSGQLGRRDRLKSLV
jgi:hypothetical protein